MMQNIHVEKTFSSPNCLATLNIGEFGGLLNHELDSSEILDVTDNFSIQSLKTMHYLAKLQISEFFKQISIRLYIINNKESINCWKLIADIQWLVSQTQHVDEKMTLMFDEIYDTCKYYKSIEASYVTQKEVQSCLKAKCPKSDLKVILHNMSLHLKAALLRLIEIENHFDDQSESCHLISKIDTDQADANSKLLMKTDSEEFKNLLLKLLPLLNIAKSEVNAFEECFDKFTKDVDPLLNPEKEIPTASIPQNETESEILNKTITNIERCDVEREIQDEVFEAIVSNTSSGDRQEGAAFIGEEARKNSELASFMLKELKNVLINKADEHRAREQVALAKKMVNAADSSDSSDPEDNKNRVEGDSVGSETIENIIIPESENECIMENTGPIDCVPADFSYSLSGKTDSFAASIAMLAAQRQKMLGLSNEEFIDGCDSSDYSDSDS
ncbi:hypothetical protein JTE90_011939 [Oedothorax gibbosus]|uniref:Uncharacterized protein n=1 Tax=Oedothorax gibbosus TaxID=931172 RepID=A0AAV6V2X4_9ARAC|nr:hypothetical protein JTE90_011939 [Oedothorax gibbosus]